MGFPRQEYWSGLPFPSSWDLLDPGIEPGSPALRSDSLPSEPPGKPSKFCNLTKFCHLLIVLQLDGDCHCKSHVGGDSCDTCEDGYFALEKSNYFGCQGTFSQGFLCKAKMLMGKDCQSNLASEFTVFLLTF